MKNKNRNNKSYIPLPCLTTKTLFHLCNVQPYNVFTKVCRSLVTLVYEVEEVETND